MQRQTKAKGIAAAVSGFLIAAIPMFTSSVSGVDVTPEQIESLSSALNALFVAVGSAIAGFIIVYLAPANRTIEE